MARVRITDLALRDGHQSLLATRMTLADMLPAAADLDQVGYWSLETWGGATFDTCIRFLNEDPWERLARLREACVREGELEPLVKEYRRAVYQGDHDV